MRDSPQIPQSLPAIADADRALMLAYVPAGHRDAVNALFALDETLGRILQTTSEPMIGQMRLTWWHEALAKLGDGAPPAEPVLSALGAARIDGAALLPIVEGWEALLDAPLDLRAMSAHAEGRGAGLFRAVATRLKESSAAVAAAGRGWALVDLAWHLSDREQARRALALAGTALAGAPTRWPRALRPLGMLVRLARDDIARGLDVPRVAGSPRRAAAMLAHRLSGRA